MAARTLHIKFHSAASLSDLPGPVAFRTFSGSLQKSFAMAIRAHVAARNIQPHHAPADCSPEGNIDLIFQIGAWLWPLFLARGRPLASSENRAKYVTETSAPAALPSRTID